MPVRINEMTSNVQLIEGDSPINEEMTERLVQIVLQRLREAEQYQGRIRDETGIKEGVSEIDPY
jgi:hypothetical protein